ncbi:unnamed protein product [Amoebophrya sp. A25]|nr:unnamed protein product [Amoebophrya sp. A25]|eukprot:GSA25T00016484001.1
MSLLTSSDKEKPLLQDWKASSEIRSGQSRGTLRAAGVAGTQKPVARNDVGVETALEDKRWSNISHLLPGILSILAAVGFARNLQIEFTTGVLWDAVTDSPHTNAKGFSLWTHLAGMLVWTGAAVYQFLYSGTYTKQRHEQLLGRTEKKAINSNDLHKNANNDNLSLEIDHDQAANPNYIEILSAQQEEDDSADVEFLYKTYVAHKTVGEYIALPALFIGGFAAAVWWQNAFGAPPTSPVYWYTVGLFLCSSVQLSRGIHHGRQVKVDRRRDRESGVVPGHQPSSGPSPSAEHEPTNLGSDSPEHRAEILSDSPKHQPTTLSDSRLTLHRMYMFVAVLWAVDPGLHRIVFWSRILACYFETTRAMFFPVGTTFDEAKDDDAGHMLVLSLGKLPVNLVLFAALAWAYQENERPRTEEKSSAVGERQAKNGLGKDLRDSNTSRAAIDRESTLVLGGNLALISFWFWGGLGMQVMAFSGLNHFCRGCVILLPLAYICLFRRLVVKRHLENARRRLWQ